MADDTITVASLMPVALQISDLPDNPDRPGELANPRTAVIHGPRHPDAVHGVGITRGVAADMFHAWMDRHPHLKDFLWEMSDEALEKHSDSRGQFGWELGLQQAEDRPTQLPPAAQEPPPDLPAPIDAPVGEKPPEKPAKAASGSASAPPAKPAP